MEERETSPEIIYWIQYCKGLERGTELASGMAG
jgi:hypothetical protein